jgi:hypothetical protein
MIEDAVRYDRVNLDELHTVATSDTYTFNRLTFKSIGDAKCYIHEEAMKVALTAALNTRT